MAAKFWRKLLILTAFVFTIILLNYDNLRRSDAHLREVGPSKMTDKELLTATLEQKIIEASEVARSLSSDHGRQEIHQKSLHRARANVLKRQLRELKRPATEPVGGYVLADDYWEQQNSGCRNLQSLQCWAAKLNMKVVEPFLVNSVLHTLPSSAAPNWLKYSQMYDMSDWNRESVRLNHSTLVPWEEFLVKAQRRVISVEFQYAYSKDVHRKQAELKENPRQQVKIKCEPHAGWPKSGQTALLGVHNFTIVRKVCLNFEYGKYLTLREFRNAILGDYSPNEVTVIFRQWRGLGIVGRILVKDSGCVNTGIQENMRPSQRLYHDANKYVSTYLSSNHSKYALPLSASLAHSGGEYIAVMARLEKSKLSFNKRKGIVPFCLEQTIKYTRKLVEESGIEMTFLSIDIGKYGSNSFRNTGDSSNLLEEFAKFFTNFYGGKLTIHEWERTFEDIGHTEDSGYIALLQKMIVVQAKCVIFVGGGAFQKHALNLYQSSRPKGEWCIRIIKECTTDKNLPMDNQ
jgi:hypothetical protein